MADLKTEIKISANADGVEAGVSKAKRSLATLGQEAEKTGERGANGLNRIGAGSEANAKKLEQTTKNFVSQIQRQIAATEAGGTANRQYQESIARIRGADLGALRPWLDQLDAAKVKADAASRAQQGLETRMGALGSVASLARGQLLAFAASITVGSVFAFVKNLNDGVDALNDIKDATGSTIENISALEDVGRRTGASFETVGSILVKFNDVLSKATPKSDMALALKAIGLEAGELRRLDPAEALRVTAVSLAGYADDANKARVIQDLFGKSVKEAAPFLTDLAEQGELVAKVTAKQAEEAERFNKELFAFQANALDAGRALAGPFVESINEVAKAFRDGSAAGKGFWESAWDLYGKRNEQRMNMLRGGIGMAPANTGGAEGSWGDPEPAAPKPSVKPPKSAAEIAAADAAARKAAEERKREAAELAKTYAELNGLTSSYYEELAKLQKQRAASTLSEELYVKAVQDLIAKQPFAIELQKQAVKASQDAADARKKESDGITAFMQAQEQAALQSLQGVKDRITSLQDEEAALNLSRAMNVSLAEAVEMVALARLREKQAGFREGSEGWESLQREITARKELLGLIAGKAARDANQKAADEAAKDWERTAQTIGDTLADYIMGGGTNAAQYLKRLFATLVLQPTVKTIVGSLLGTGSGGGIGGLLGGGDGGGLGMLSNLTNLGSLFGGGSQILAGFQGASLAAGLAGPTTAGATGLMGIGNMLAAVPGWGWAIAGVAALAAIGKSFKGETRTGGQFGVAFDGSVTNERRGQTYTYQGQQYDRDFSNGERIGLTDGQAYRLEGDPVDMAQEDAIRKAVSGTASGINAMLKALGSAATVTGFSAGLETSEKGRGGVFAGGKLSNGNTFGESGTGDNYAGTLYEKFSTNSPDFKTALENFTLDLKQSTIQALQGVEDIPESIKKMLKVDAESLSSEAADALLIAINTQIAGVTNFKAALDAMGMDKFAKMTFDSAAGIAELSGGFDALQSNMGTYYDKFFSPEERRANLQSQLQEQLGKLDIKLPDIDATDARAQYRRLIEAQDENTEAGRKAIAVLLQLAGAFDSIAAAGEDAAAAAAEAARKQQSITDKGRDLEQRLLIAQGKDRQALDLRRLQEYYALLDLNPALAAMVIEIYKAEDAAEALAKAQQDREDAYGKLQDAATLESERINAQLEGIDAQRTAINAQRALADESLGLITGIFDLVRSNARDLYGDVEATAAMQAAQGWAFVEQALANVQSTGYLPDQAKLQEAIGAARGGLDMRNYASGAELDFDRLVLAGQLSQIEAISGGQKSAAQQQLDALEAQTEELDRQTKVLQDQLRAQDKVLEYWRRQIEIANGTFDATITVAEAINTLNALLRPKDQGANVNTKAPPQVNGGGASWGGGSTPTAAPAAAKYSQVMSAGTAGVWYEPIIDQALIARLDALAPVYHSYDGTGDLKGLLDAFKGAGGTMQDLSILSGFYLIDWIKAGATVGMPAFAKGTNYVPGDMVAQIHQGERIIPAADNRALFRAIEGGGSRGGSGRLELLVEELAGKLDAVTQELLEIRGTNEQLASQFDNWTKGGTGAAPVAVRNTVVVETA